MMENIVKVFWHDSDETNLKATEGKSGKFDLKLGSLLVGTLLYNGNIWQFSYSEEFKNANCISTGQTPGGFAIIRCVNSFISCSVVEFTLSADTTDNLLISYPP